MSTRSIRKYAAAHAALRALAAPTRAATVRSRVLEKASRLLPTLRHASADNPYALATALYFADRPDVDHLVSLADDKFVSAIYEDPAFDKYLSEARDLLEDAPANAAGTGAVAGLLGDPPVRRRHKKR